MEQGVNGRLPDGLGDELSEHDKQKEHTPGKDLDKGFSR